MTRERAVEVLDRWCGYGHPDEEYANVGFEANINDVEEAHDMAIAALREQEERSKNEPLTIKELRMKIGEPVWVVTNGLKEWCIVHSYHSPDVIGGGFIMTRRTAEKRIYSFDGCGKTWFTYGRKLEVEG